jgi:zinc protease
MQGVGRGVAVLGAALGCADVVDRDGPPFALAVPVQRARLDNGLEVVVIPNHTSPVVTALVAVRAGSAIEDPASNGYSHLVAHMIFEGSEAVPDTREFHAALDDLGVLRNGTTGTDRVTYYLTADTAALEPALTLFAGAIVAPALDPALLEKEKQVVLGELDISESDADFLRYRATLSELYGQYATRLDPFGSREAVASATVEQLRAMHATYYVPNNSMLVLSGDLTVDEAVPLSDRLFGAWPSGADPIAANPPPLPEPLATNHYFVMPSNVSFSNIEVWWRGPSLDEDPGGVLAGQLLSEVTFQTDHAFRDLVRPNLVFNASLTLEVRRRVSYVQVELIVAPRNEQAALAGLREVIASIGVAGDVTDAQLETAREDAFRSYLFTSADPSALPHALANAWALGDSHTFFREVDALYGVDRGALKRFADTYLRGKPSAVVLMSSAENINQRAIDASWLRSAFE